MRVGVLDQLFGASGSCTHLRRCWSPVALLVAVSGGLPLSSLADLDDIRFRASVEQTYDDNLSRAMGSNRLADTFTTATFGATLPLNLAHRVRVVTSASLGAERFSSLENLDRNFAEGQLEFQYRSSGQFGTPTWGAFVRGGADAYRSTLRDGYRHGAGLSLRLPITDRIFSFASIAVQERDGRSRVFDTKEVAVRGHLDYALGDRHTTYISLEGRRGDIVSVARSNLAFLDIADALIADDAFTDVPRIAYRFKARTVIATLGYNWSVAEKVSLDFSLRCIVSTPDEQPPAGVYDRKIEYFDRQAAISILVRF